MAILDVVILAPGRLGWLDEIRRRTVSFAASEPVPRIGECVVLAFAAGACRWTVEDVAHAFGESGHEIAVRLSWEANEPRAAVSSDQRMDARPPDPNGPMWIETIPVGR